MDRFWRSVSIVMGALLATGCIVRTKYGIADTEDTADTAFTAEQVTAPDVLDAPPLASPSLVLPVAAGVKPTAH